MTKKEHEKIVLDGVKRLLKSADFARENADDIRRSFGECPGFQDKHWEAYYKEEAAEYLCFYILKKILILEMVKETFNFHDRQENAVCRG